MIKEYCSICGTLTDRDKITLWHRSSVFVCGLCPSCDLKWSKESHHIIEAE